MEIVEVITATEDLPPKMREDGYTVRDGCIIPPPSNGIDSLPSIWDIESDDRPELKA